MGESREELNELLAELAADKNETEPGTDERERKLDDMKRALGRDLPEWDIS